METSEVKLCGKTGYNTKVGPVKNIKNDLSDEVTNGDTISIA